MVSEAQIEAAARAIYKEGDLLADFFEPDEIRDLARAALIAAGKVEPKVKPLEWETEPYLLEEMAKTTALSPFGRYFADDHTYWGPGTIISTGYTDIAMSKAAAQADYEARILSALATEGE